MPKALASSSGPPTRPSSSSSGSGSVSGGPPEVQLPHFAAETCRPLWCLALGKFVIDLFLVEIALKSELLIQPMLLERYN